MTPRKVNGRVRLQNFDEKRVRLLKQSMGRVAATLEKIHGGVILSEDGIDEERRRSFREAARELRLAAMLIDEACE